MHDRKTLHQEKLEDDQDKQVRRAEDGLVFQ
jgi:hypothetical protein